MSITENAIRILAAACPKLTVFKAEGCTHVSKRRRTITSTFAHRMNLSDDQPGCYWTGKELSEIDLFGFQSMFRKTSKASILPERLIRVSSSR